MDETYRKVIEAEIRLGKLSLGPEDDKSVLNYAEYNEIIYKMLRIVAKETSTDVARRFINTGRALFNYRRKGGESYSDFVDQSREVAQEHLNCLQREP